MKVIKVKFLFRREDLNQWYREIFCRILEKRFVVQQEEDSPEFIFHDAHLVDILIYQGVRISIAGENVRTDFNISDYGVGFDHLKFLDRYQRYPLYLFYSGSLELAEKRCQNFHLQKKEDLLNRKFCNFLVSNGNATEFRSQFFHHLSKYKPVDSGGRYLKNINEVVKNKLDWQKGYKFSICFENSSTSGYLTEKLIQAYAADTVPIYWGDPDAFGTLESGKGGINPKAVIWADPNFPDNAIQQIKGLDNDPDLYLKMYKEPLFLEENHSLKLQEELEGFLFRIFDQNKEQAYRRGFGQMRLRVENRNIARSSIIRSLTNFIMNRKRK